MSRTSLALLTAFALGATACGGDPGDRDTTPARAERREPPRDEERDEPRATDDDDEADDEEEEEDDEITVMDQGSSDSDVAITQQLRQAVIADDRLSFGAKNIAIITRDGVVTLRGEVDTAEEHAVLQELANGVEGVRRLDDQVEVEAD